MSQPNDSNKSVIALEQDNTMIAVIEMGQASWLVAGIVPGLERQPLKKLRSDEQALFQLLQRWRNEAVQTGRTIKRLVVAYEAGRDGFWLARWLRARDIEAYVIHPNSVAVSREHRRAKTDRLDTELLKRAFLGWLRGEAGHCSMAAIPTIEEEDARRPNRERENLVGERTRIVNRMKATLARFGIRSFKFTLRHADERLNDLRTAEAASLPANTHAELRRDIARLRVVRDQIKEIEQQRLQRIEQAAPSEKSPHAMIRLLARVIGIGVETADMLVNEILSRQLRDRSGGALCRLDRLAGRERQAAAGEGPLAGGQRAGTSRHDSARLALFDVPEGQCIGAMVPCANGACARWHTKDHDRRACTQTAHRAVAHGDDRRNPRRYFFAPGGSLNNEISKQANRSLIQQM